MPFMITDDCISCAACEPICPNHGIRKDERRSVYVIDSDSCTECVGFSNKQQCAVVCPMGCCVLDPRNVETEAVLFERAKTASYADPNKRPTLSPETSHFRTVTPRKWWERLFRRDNGTTLAADVTQVDLSAPSSTFSNS